MTRTEYTIRATDLRSNDLRAAADACNRALAEAGETHIRDAAQAQIDSCHECLRDGLVIEASEVTYSDAE